MPSKLAKLSAAKGDSPNLREAIYRQIKEAIISGDVQPGSWLQEEQVTQALAVSRTPVREAFNRLKGEGLFEIVPRKGARVADMSRAQVDALFETRAHIELAYFEHSAASLSPDYYARCRKELVEVETRLSTTPATEPEWDDYRREFSRIDRAFHDELIRACGNEYWIRMYFQIRDLIIISSNGRSLAEESVLSAIREHHQILDAIDASRYGEAKSLLESHILKTRHYANVLSARSRGRSSLSS